MPEEATQPSGSARKPMTPAERARHASLVRWGKEQPFAARLEAVRQRRKAAKQKKARGKGKGKAPKPTAAEKEAERAKQMQANVESVGNALNESDNATLSKNGLAALVGAAEGQEPPVAMAQGLIDSGLAVRGQDGRYRLTSDGQAIVRAAESGDTNGVLDRLSAVNDKNVAAAEKEKTKEEKAPKGGGGGGAGKEKPTEEEKEKEKAQKKADNRAKVAAQMADNDAGVSPRGLEALAALASGEQVDEALVDGLTEMGLVEVDSEGNFRATTQGRSAVRAAERGDYGATIDAVSRAKDRKAKKEEREQAKRERQAERRKREDERRAKEDERRRQEDEEDGLPPARKPRDNPGPMRPGRYDGKAIEVKQTAQERAMFANMGSSGGGGGGGGGKPSGGTGGLWKRGPDGKRTPQAGFENKPKGKERDDRPKLREGLSYGPDVSVRDLTPDHSIHIPANRRSGTISGRIIKVNRSTVEYEASYMGKPMRLKARHDELIGGYAHHGNTVHAIKTTEIDAMSDYTAVIEDMEALRDEIEEIAQDTDLEIKAGRRNNRADQEDINRGYAMAEELCELFEALGATVEEEPEDDETMGGDAAMYGVSGKGIESLVVDGEEIVTLPGYSIKAIGAGQTEGYLVRFGGDGDLSEWRDMFDRDTDYGRATKSDVWVHHRMLPGLGKRRLTNQADIGMDDEGVFIKHLLDLRSSYERKLYDLAQQGKLGWSSGTAPHLVERKALGDGRHKIEQWPLGLDASYTPMPAGGFGVEARASAMKSLFADAGIDLLNAIYDNPEAPQDERERPDEVKAQSERARRLLLRSRLLALQE